LYDFGRGSELLCANDLVTARTMSLCRRLHACLTLASAGMVITSASGADSPLLLCLGLSLSVVALFLMWYAYRTFLWRMSRIRSRAAERADDPIGPIVISASVVVALASSAVLSFSSAFG